MQNLDQIRAAAALQCVDGISRSKIAGFPALIMQNGLLAAFAYASEGSRPELEAACSGAARHLANEVHGITPLKGKTTPAGVIAALSASGSCYDLQRATSETLAFFSYLKRFAIRN